MAVSPNSTVVAVGGSVHYGEPDSAVVQLWDVTASKRLATLCHRGPMLEALRFSPDGKLLATADERGVYLWNVATGKLQFPIGQFRAFDTRDLAFSGDGKVLACDGGDNTIHVWDVGTGTEIGQRPGPDAPVSELKFSPDGKTLVSGGDATVRRWDVATGKQLPALRGHESRVHRLVFSSDGKRLVSGGEDSFVIVWDLATSMEMRRFGLDDSQHRRRHNASGPVMLAAGGTTLWASCFNRDVQGSATDSVIIRAWDVGSGRQIFSREENNSCDGPGAFSPDATLMLTGRGVACGTETGKQLFALGSEPDFAGYDFASDGKTFACAWGGEKFRGVIVFKAATGNEVLRIPASPCLVRMSREGKFLAFEDGDMVRVWDIVLNREIWHLRPGAEVQSLALSGDGRTLACGLVDCTILLCDVASPAK